MAAIKDLTPKVVKDAALDASGVLNFKKGANEVKILQDFHNDLSPLRLCDALSNYSGASRKQWFVLVAWNLAAELNLNPAQTGAIISQASEFHTSLEKHPYALASTLISLEKLLANDAPGLDLAWKALFSLKENPNKVFALSYTFSRYVDVLVQCDQLKEYLTPDAISFTCDLFTSDTKYNGVGAHINDLLANPPKVGISQFQIGNTILNMQTSIQEAREGKPVKLPHFPSIGEAHLTTIHPDFGELPLWLLAVTVALAEIIVKDNDNIEVVCDKLSVNGGAAKTDPRALAEIVNGFLQDSGSDARVKF